MTPPLRIRTMSPADLGIALDWAAAEGWNPGLDDAMTFRAADAEGFLMGWVRDEPVACISVVRHSAVYGFLGFYICRPDHRGQGHGWALWQAGLAHLGDRTVGLDGVPAQEENYRRSGFEFAFRSHRHEGEIKGRTHAEYVRPESGDMARLIALDASVNGVERPAYTGAWLRDTDSRHTLVRREGERIAAMGTIRACRAGHKIGPLVASDGESAVALVESLVAASGANRVAIDIPETSHLGPGLAKRFGLESAFACARMYRGTAPATDMSALIGLTSFELG